MIHWSLVDDLIPYNFHHKDIIYCIRIVSWIHVSCFVYISNESRKYIARRAYIISRFQLIQFNIDSLSNRYIFDDFFNEKLKNGWFFDLHYFMCLFLKRWQKHDLLQLAGRTGNKGGQTLTRLRLGRLCTDACRLWFQVVWRPLQK